METGCFRVYVITKMRVLMVSRDIKALDKDSQVFTRLKKYAPLFEELHVVVCARGKTKVTIKDKNLTITPAVSNFLPVAFLKDLILTFIVA